MPNILSTKALLVSLQVSAWVGRKNEKNVTQSVLEEHNASKNAGNFTKRLLSSDATSEIYSIIRSLKAYHWQHTQPWLNDGTRILPTKLYPDYSSTMRKMLADLEEAVAKFVKEYPKHIERAKTQGLGKLFNADDYPSVSEIKTKFGVRIAYMPVPDTADFRAAVDAGSMKELKKDLEERLQEQLDSALKDTASRIMTAVKHMAERLAEYKPANMKKGIRAENTFRNSLVENVVEIAELIPAFNLSEDKKMEKLRKKIMQELNVDPDVLRSDSQVRNETKLSAERILAEVEEFMK